VGHVLIVKDQLMYGCAEERMQRNLTASSRLFISLAVRDAALRYELVWFKGLETKIGTKF
jgi:hypothetical protein